MSDDKKEQPGLVVAKAPPTKGSPSAPPPESEEVLEAKLEARIERVVEERVFQIIASFHQGPLPTPQDLAGYEGALPGTANRVVRMAEIEQENRHLADRRDADNQAANDREIVRIFSRNTLFGLIAGSVISGGTIGGGIWLIYLNKQTAGLAAIIAALVGLVGVFIARSISAARESASDPKEVRKSRPTPPHVHADVNASGAVRRT